MPNEVIEHAVLLANRMRRQEKLCMPHNKQAERQSQLLEKLHQLLIETVQQPPDSTGQTGADTKALWQEIVQCAK